MRNTYLGLKAKIILTTIQKRKLTFKKFLNALSCFWASFVKSPRSAKGPMIISFELDNHCNANCLFCRDERGNLYDSNPQGTGISVGTMPLEMYKDIISQVCDYSLIAILYTNGEPLLYKNIAEAVRFATDHNLSTMIATNGQLLTEEKIKNLLDFGIDFIKVALSGFTQETFKTEVRYGNVEKIKENIKTLIRLKDQGRYQTIVMLDFIVYGYNRHQVEDVRRFCKNLNIMLNLRPGNPRGGLETSEEPLHQETLPLNISCDWIWKGIQIDWNGDVFPCCECPLWSGAPKYSRFETGKTRILDVWNGKAAQRMRHALTAEGRKAIPICAACLRRGIAFKW